MANNIKGITIELGGNTGPLTTALKDVEKTGRSLQSELKEVNKQLKFDPTNTDLLRQKQTLLAKEISNTKDKLTTLKEAEKQTQEQMQNGTLGEDKYRALQREVEKTESQLKDLEKQAKETGSVLGIHLQEAGSKISSAGSTISGVGQKLLPVTGAIAGIGAAAVKTGDDYEAQMSRVSAISGATGSDLKSLNYQALQLGQDTAFSASEAAEGMENLASAGFSTKEITEAMPGMLDLAASSGEDLATSSDIAASTLRGFNLAAGDAGHVADVLAKNAANTNAAVADTGDAMKYIAPVAQNAGWSLESVTAAIGEMADAGIKGEQAGTTLRGALTNLMNPSKEQAAAMKEIGFNAYDAQGKMKPLSQIVGELGEKTAGMTGQQRDQVIATIMGTNALSGMQVLLKDGKGNLNEMTTSLQNSDGAAQKMADTMQGNTKGAIEQMKGALETAAIKIQQILAPTITKIAKSVSELVSKFSALSPATQKVILIVAGVVAAIGPLLILIGKITQGIGGITKGVGLLMAHPMVALVLAIIAAIVLLVLGIKHLWDTNEGFRIAVTNIWNGIQTVISTVVNAIVGFFTVTIPQAWNGLVSFFQGIPAWWSNLWTQVGQFFTDLWNGIISFFTTTIPQWIQSVIQWFNELPYRIGYAIGQLLASIVNFGVDAWNWVTTELPKIINGIIQWFQQLPGKIWAFLVQVVTNIGQWCANMLNTVRTQIPILISNIVSFFSELPGKIWTFLTDVVSKVVQWAGNLVTTAQTEIPKFVSKVIEFVSELPGKMLDIGKNIVHGIWDGIAGAVDWLHDRISSFCQGIVDGFKSHLKIHSPSQLFADVIGKNIALGIGQGFTDNISAVMQAMTAAIPSVDTGPQVRAAMTAAYGDYPIPADYPGGTAGGASGEDGGRTEKIEVNQYFQGKVPSPAEHARKTRNELQQVVLKLRK